MVKAKEMSCFQMAETIKVRQLDCIEVLWKDEVQKSFRGFGTSSISSIQLMCITLLPLSRFRSSGVKILSHFRSYMQK